MSTVHNLRPRPLPQRRVLVVDDDLDTVQSMALLLKLSGHDVQFAINGLAAIDIARKFRPEVMFIDMGLPDFNGDQIAIQLKFEPGLENMRIIAISGRSGDEHRERALAAGCDDYRLKPLDAPSLEELVVKR